MKKVDEDKILKGVWNHGRYFIKIDLKVNFKKSDGKILSVPAKKIIPLEYIIRQAIRKGYFFRKREEKGK